MKLAVHALTAAAMVGTAAALGLWLDPWWIGVLVAVVVDGAWLLAGRMEATLTTAALDARRPRTVAWIVAALSASLLLVHAVTEGSIAWGAVAVLPVVSRVLAWTADAMQQAQITPAAAERIETLRQEARDRTAVARAALLVEAEEERVRLETVSTETQALAASRAAALDRIASAYEATRASRSAVPAPTGWTVAQLAPADRDSGPERVSPSPAPAPVPAPAKALVICGGHLPIPGVPERPKLDTAAAREAIERAWRDGLSIREAARVSTRSPSQVQRVYAAMDDRHGPAPIEGQTTLELTAA